MHCRVIQSCSCRYTRRLCNSAATLVGGRRSGRMTPFALIFENIKNLISFSDFICSFFFFLFFVLFCVLEYMYRNIVVPAVLISSIFGLFDIKMSTTFCGIMCLALHSRLKNRTFPNPYTWETVSHPVKVWASNKYFISSSFSLEYMFWILYIFQP